MMSNFRFQFEITHSALTFMYIYRHMTRGTTPLEEPNIPYNSINATELDNNNIISDHGTILKEKSEMPKKN